MGKIRTCRRVALLMGAMLWSLLPAGAWAQQMFLDNRQGRTGTDWAECMARAKRALEAERWAIGGEYGANVRGAYMVAWRDRHGVIFGCDVEPDGRAFFHLTMSGLGEGNLPLMEALMRRMGQASTGPAVPPPNAKTCWTWYGEFLDGRIATQGTMITLEPNGVALTSWGWQGNWRSVPPSGVVIDWKRGPGNEDQLSLSADGRTLEGRNFETRLIRGSLRPCP